MKLNEVTTLKSQTILTESWSELTESQHRYLGRFERELWPLMEELKTVFEADLTTDQIKNIFTGAEASAKAGGNNRTALGKAADVAKIPVDVMKKVDAKINELGKMAAQAGPIKNADAKFEELKKKIGSSDSKIAAGVKKISDWAKANPGKASLAVGILTAVAAFAGGPAGGAAAGFLLRSTTGLLKGEKLSTAVGKAAKTAAYGALAGMAFRALSDTILDNVMATQEAEWVAMEEAYQNANLDAAKDEIAKQFGLESVDTALDGVVRYQSTGSYNAFNWNYDVMISPENRGTFDALKSAMDNAESFSQQDIIATMKFHDFMAGLVNDPEANKLAEVWNAMKQLNPGELTSDQLDALMAASDDMDKLYDTIEGMGAVGAAAIQGAANIVDDNKKTAIQAKPVDPKKLEKAKADAEEGEKEAVDYDYETQFNEYLEEGPLDAIKKGASAVGGAIKKGAAAVGRGASNLTNKVTADKLMKQWKKMGEPKDMGTVVNILAGAGLTNDQISGIGKEQKVKLPAPTKPEAGADTTDADGTPVDKTFDKSQKMSDFGKVGKDAEPMPKDGATGKDGAPGIAGTPGKAGADGKAGAPGKDGAPSNVTPIDKNKDGKDDNTGKVIQMPGTKPADGVGAPQSGIAKGAASATPKQGQAKATAPSGQANAVDVPTLAKQISDAGVGAEIKAQLSGTQGGGSDLGQGLEIDIPTLAQKISDAGMQQSIKQQLTTKEPA